MFLLVLLISNLTAFSQDSTKYCLNPAQRRFVLTQAYQLKECDSVSKSKDAQIVELWKAIDKDKQLLITADDKLQNANDKIVARDGDIEFLKKESAGKDKKIKKQKLGIGAIGIFSLIKSCFIGYLLIKGV